MSTSLMEVSANVLRGCIVAPPGKKLVVADLANIEGRGQAWLAGEEWKLQAFCDFDAGIGHDLYALAYAKSFHVTPESVMADKKAGGNQRQIGKVMELAFGYQGRVGACVTFLLAYGMEPEDVARQALPYLDEEMLTESRGFLDWWCEQGKSTLGLSDDAFVVFNIFATSWRGAHTAIASYWKELEDAALEAVESPGRTITARKLKLRRDGAWLRIALPSGRSLCYPQARVDGGKLSYMGINQYSRKWCRIKTYGGKLFENACQGFARDVLFYNTPAIEDAGYAIVLKVHDEPVTEAPDSPEFNADELCKLLTRAHSWAPDLPLAAGGYEAYRYRKD